jgi:hypothetical protein
MDACGLIPFGDSESYSEPAAPFNYKKEALTCARASFESFLVGRA